MSSKERITDELDEKQTAYMSALERVNKVKEKESEIEDLELILSDPAVSSSPNPELEEKIEKYREKLGKAEEELEEAREEVEKARKLARAQANISLKKSLIDYSVDTWKITEIKGANKVWESPALPGVKITEQGRSGQPSWIDLDEGALQNKIFQELKKMKGAIIGKFGKSKINTSGVGYKPGGQFRADRENRGFGKNPYFFRSRGTTTLYGSTNPAQKEKDLKRLGEGNNRWDWLLDGGTNGGDDETGLSITVTKEDVRRLEKEYKEFYQKMGLETTWTTGLGYVTTLPWVKKGTQQPIIINDYIDILAPQYLKRASVASDAPTTIDSKKAVVTPSASTASSPEVIEATRIYNEALKKVRRKETHIKDLEVRLATPTLKPNLRAQMKIAIEKHGLELIDFKNKLTEAENELARAEAEAQAQAAGPAPGPAPKSTSWFGRKATVAPAPSSKNWRKTTNTLTQEQGENEKNEIQSLIRHLMFFRDSLTGNLDNLDKTRMDRSIVLPNTGISALKGSNFSIKTTQNGTRRKSKGNWTPLVYSFRTDDPHKTGLEPSKLPTGIDEDASKAGVYICVSYPGYYNLTTILSGRNTMTEILEAMLGYARENYRSYYDDVLTAYLIATSQKEQDKIENSIRSQVLNIYKKKQGIIDDIDKRAQEAEGIQGLLDESSIEATAQLMANTKLKPLLKKEQNEQLSAKAKEKQERVLQKARKIIDQRLGTAAGDVQAATASAVVSSVGGMNQGGGKAAKSAMIAVFTAANMSGAATVTKSGEPVSSNKLPEAAAVAAVTQAAAAAAASPALQSQAAAALTAALAGLSSPLSVASSVVPLTTPLAATSTSLTKRPRSAPLMRSAAAAASPLSGSPLLLPPSVTPFTAASTPPAAPAAAAAENNSKRMAATAERLARSVTNPKRLFANLKEFTELVEQTLKARKENKMELVKLIAGDLGINILECITKIKDRLTEEKKDSLFLIGEGLRARLGMLRSDRIKSEVEAIQVLKDILKIMNDIMSIITNKKKGGARKTHRAQKTRRRRARKTRR